MLPLAQKTRTGEIKLILASGSARRKLLFETAVIIEPIALIYSLLFGLGIRIWVCHIEFPGKFG